VSSALPLLLALVAGPARGAVADRVAAVVNDDVITLTEVYELGADYIEQTTRSRGGGPQARREVELEVLDSLIQRRLVAQEIERLALDVDDTEVDRAIDDVAQRNGLDRDALRREVEASGLAWSDYRDEIRESLREMRFSQAVIQPRITVDEDELLDAWQRTYASVERPKRYDLGLIFLPIEPGAGDEARALVQARAAEAAARLASGEDFEAVAKVYDQGPYADKGGRFGLVRPEDLRGQLGLLLRRLGAGETSTPHEDALGIWIVRSFGEVADPAPPLESVRDQLMEQVYSGRIEEETELWYRQARRRAAVQVKLEVPGAP
jgi:peptidyl-prolyl cis-trans isomerase SurA